MMGMPFPLEFNQSIKESLTNQELAELNDQAMQQIKQTEKTNDEGQTGNIREIATTQTFGNGQESSAGQATDK